MSLSLAGLFMCCAKYGLSFNFSLTAGDRAFRIVSLPKPSSSDVNTDGPVYLFWSDKDLFSDNVFSEQ